MAPPGRGARPAARRWPAPAAVGVLRLVAGALALALVLGLVAQVQAARRLTDLVDRTWRGSYDLIVSAPGSAPSPEALREPLDTAAWTSAVERLTPADLARLRAVEGVEIAAPLGDLAVQSVSNQDPFFFAYPADGSVTGPHAYDVDVRVVTDDGLAERPVLSMEATFIGDFSEENTIPAARPLIEDPSVCVPAPPEPGPCTDVELPTLAFGPKGQAPDPARRELPAGTYWAAPMTPPDPQGNRLVVVDAAAEAQLLALAGRDATARAYRALAQAGPAGGLGDLQQRLGGIETPESRALQEAEQLLPAVIEDLTLETGRAPGSVTVVPLLASTVGSAPLRMDVTTREYANPVTRILPTSTRPDDGSADYAREENHEIPRPRWALPDGGTTDQERSVSVDVSAVLGGLGLGTTVIPLPGPATDQQPMQDLTAPRMHLVQATGTLSRGAAAMQEDGLSEAAALETASGTLPGGTPEPAQRVIPGSTSQESAYYAVTEDGRRFGDGDAPLMLSVGTVEPEAESDLAGIAPLLTDTPLPTTLVTDAAGQPSEASLRPASTGFGLANQMPAAYVDASAMGVLGVAAPFSTVRVRVAGVGEDLSPENLARIDAVAQSLREAGFAAVPVVASSLSPRQVEVLGYRFDATDGAPGSATPAGGAPTALGTIRQLGPELGASQRVSAAVGSAGLTNTMTVLATLGVLAALCIAAAVVPRRRRAALLSLHGWSTATTAARHLREDGVTLAVLLALAGGLAAVGWQPGRLGVDPLLLQVGAGTALGLAAATALAGVLAARPASQSPRAAGASRRARVPGGLVPLALRWTGRTVPRVVVDAACRVAAALGAALLMAVLLRSRREAGASFLAGDAVAQDLPFQAGLGGLAVVVGLVLLVQLHRVEGPAVRAEAALLVQHGFTRARILVRHLVPMLVSLIAAAAVVAGVGVLILPSDDLAPALAAAGTVLILTVLATVATRRSQIARAWKKGPTS